MNQSWMWSGLLALSVVACLSEDKSADTADGSDGADGGADGAGLDDTSPSDGGSEGAGSDGAGSDGGGSSGGGSDGGLTELAVAICAMYEDCGFAVYYFGAAPSSCVDSVTEYYQSYGCTQGPTYYECIAEIDATGCDYYYYGGSGICYDAVECSGGGYYYYYYYSYYY